MRQKGRHQREGKRAGGWREQTQEAAKSCNQESQATEPPPGRREGRVKDTTLPKRRGSRADFERDVALNAGGSKTPSPVLNKDQQQIPGSSEGVGGAKKASACCQAEKRRLSVFYRAVVSGEQNSQYPSGKGRGEHKNGPPNLVGHDLRA